MPTVITATIDPAGGRVDARTSRSQPIMMDVDPPEGGDTAAGPKEVLLASLAGCTAIDVASILRKKRQMPTSYEIEVSGESAEEHPRVFTRITVEHRVRGDVAAEALRRSIELSATRYCPVSAMLSAAVRIEHRYRLTDATGVELVATVAITGPEGPVRTTA